MNTSVCAIAFSRGINGRPLFAGCLPFLSRCVLPACLFLLSLLDTPLMGNGFAGDGRLKTGTNCPAGILYVNANATGANDGSSWADAYINLQDALANNCPDITQIWVAAGVYKPTSGTDRGISFSLRNGVAIYGGFPNTGNPDMDDRDWTTHVTTLSGDIGVANNNTDNSYHVIYNLNVNNTALLDGFVISGGNAGGTTNVERHGGAMYNHNSSPGISHCAFSGNTALFTGGALYNYQSSHATLSNCTFSNNTAGSAGGAASNTFSSAPEFSDCTFSGNSAGSPGYSEGGGAVFNSGNASPVFNQCAFTGNTVVNSSGGAMANNGASPTLEDCTFSQNTAPNSAAAGMYNYSASPTLTNCSFSQNTASSAAGMYNLYSYPILNNCTFLSNTATAYGGGAMENTFSAPTLNDCTFNGNTSPGYGGGIHNSESPCVLNRCVFTANTAFGGGGIAFNYSSNAVLNQCLFAGNSSANSGGGVYIAAASPSLTNCNFIGNTSEYGGAVQVNSGAPVFKNCSVSGNAAQNGGAMFTFSTAVTLTNCILWGNNSGIGANPGIFANVSYSIVQQSSGVYPGTGNLNLNPLFVDQPPVGLGTAGDLHLQQCSPAIDAGTNADAPAEDYGDNPRPFNAVGTPEALTDMGAWEYQSAYTPAATPSVSISGPAAVNCSTPAVYTATPVNGGASPVFQWKINGNNVGANSSTFSTSTLQTGDVLSCDLLSSIPCAYPVIATSNTIQVTLDPPPGDPAVFGDGEWRVYAWNAGGAAPTPGSWNTDYKGYYIATGLNFNTQSRWNAGLSPSAASGYQGCAVGNDNHSYSAKRRGFPCGYYRISIDSHDDAAQLWIDGAQVWEHIGCCDNHPNEWEGFLDASSELEFRVTEGDGGSHGAISFQLVTPAITGLTGLCSASTATLSVSGNIQGNYAWSTGETTPSIEITAPGAYSVTIGDGGACSVTASGAAVSPQGDPAVFGSNEWRVYAWNSGGATPDANTWTANYTGYYTVNSVHLNTQNQWNNATSPSGASNYAGCTVGNDNHSYSAKRRGFTCGAYAISIDAHKDHAELWVNGVKVWEHSGCCDNHPNVWYGLLDGQTEIEFRVTHGTGASYGAISINPFTPALTGLNSLCGNPSATLSVSNNPSGNYLWSTGETTPTIQITSGGVYSVTVSTGSGCSTVLSGQAAGPVGNPAEFGANAWKVYAWNAGGAEPNPNSWNTAYSGFYTVNSLNLNTQHQWSASLSPSAAQGYQGCSVGNDNHSFSAKRQGFPCNYYRIHIDSHDDAAQLWIDGQMVWEHIGCCDVHPNVWEGFLGAGSTVEFRVTEGGGGSHGAISFLAGIQLTGTPVICHGAADGSVAAPQISGASYVWSTGDHNFEISDLPAGVYSVTVSLPGCDDFSAIYTIEESPEISVSVSGATSICQGGATTLQADITGPAIWNSGSYTFVKTSPGQADQITPYTHITRGSNGFIYNAVYQNGPSGSGGVCQITITNVEWAAGDIDDWATLTYTNHVPIPSCAAPDIVNMPLVMHLIQEDIYLPVLFTYWQSGGGGNFTYTRTTGPSYQWSTGETTPAISVNAAGTYTVVVHTGGNSCSSEASHTVTTFQPTFTATPQCAGANGGQIAVSGETGGAGPYQYSIDNGVSYQAGAIFTGLAASTYPVRIKDAGDCESAPVPVTVEQCNNDILLSGTIYWEHNGTSGVQNATVNLTGPATGNDLSDQNGGYLISIPPTVGNFVLKPTKNTNKLNGVSSADVTAIQQHVTNIAPLPAPFKRIAADVNRSNSISTLDATILNQALQGNPSALNLMTSWRFVPSSYTFPNPNAPWGFPEQINLTNPTGNVTGQDFKGIKLGDVAATWANPANFGKGEPLVLRLRDQTLQAGAEVSAEFRADQLDDLNSFQFALHFDPERLQLLEIEPLSGLPLSTDHFGTYNVAEGEVRVVWAQPAALMLSEAAPLFRLRFRALESGARLSEALRLNGDALPGYVYNSKYAESGVELRYATATNTGQTDGATALTLENQPNPFVETTTLRFMMPRAGEAALRISDAAGRLLFSQKKQYTEGPQQEVLQLEGVRGVLFAELVTEQGSVVRKMLAGGN